ncbi:unnamed protein product, partial [Cladocopium goreaui]
LGADALAAAWEYEYTESGGEVQQEASVNSGHFRFRPGFVPRKMCSFMETTGYCQKGDACTFAHSAEELQNAEGSNFQEVKGDVQEPQEVEVEVVEDAPVGLKQEKPADTKLETEAVAGSRFRPGFIPRRMCSTFESTGYCKFADACTFAHSLDELEGGTTVPKNVYVQQAQEGAEVAPNSNVIGPRVFQGNFRPSVLCKMWIKHPSQCQDGDACTFAHGLLELRGDLQEHLGMLRTIGFFGARAMPDPDPTAMALYAEASHGSKGSKGSKGSWSKGMGSWSGKSDAFADAAAAYAAAPNEKGARGGNNGKFMPEETHVVNRFKVRNFPSLRPVKLCNFWVQSPEMCQRGESCTFAHGVAELNPQALAMNEGVSRFLHTGFTPRVMCKNITGKGSCSRGLFCSFAHSDLEMQ